MQAVARTSVYDRGIWACRGPWKREEATDGDHRLLGDDYYWFCVMCILIFFNLIHLMARNFFLLNYGMHVCLLGRYIISLHFFGHLTGPDVWASLQLDDLDCEKEECYGMTSARSIKTVEVTPTSRNFTAEWSGISRDFAKIHGLPSVHEQATMHLLLASRYWFTRPRCFRFAQLTLH